MRKALLSILIGTSPFSANGHAENFYFTLGYSALEREDSFPIRNPDTRVSASADANIIEGGIGFEQNPYLSWEARLGFGSGSDNITYTYDGISIDGGKYKITTHASVYARPQFKYEDFLIYGLLGYAGFKEKVENYYDHYDGFVFGVGAGLVFGANSLSVEWKRMNPGDDVKLSGLSFVYQHDF